MLGYASTTGAWWTARMLDLSARGNRRWLVYIKRGRQTLSSSSRRKVFVAIQIVLVSLLSVAAASAQAAQTEKPPMADEVFKNIQVLRGLTVDQFMGTMGFIAASLSLNCSECHDTSSTAAYA